MIDEARRLNTTQPACRFLVNDQADLRKIPSSSFDLILSLITLQHVSDRTAIRSYLREFVQIVSQENVIVFQLPTKVAWRVRFHPRSVFTRALWRLPRRPAAVTRALGSASLTLSALSEQEVRR